MLRDMANHLKTINRFLKKFALLWLFSIVLERMFNDHNIVSFLNSIRASITISKESALIVAEKLAFHGLGQFALKKVDTIVIFITLA